MIKTDVELARLVDGIAKEDPEILYNYDIMPSDKLKESKKLFEKIVYEIRTHLKKQPG